jgi:hypothetical protein
MRRPAGIGSCVAIISRTLAIAAGVRVTGATAVGALTTSGVLGTDDAVAIGNLL